MFDHDKGCGRTFDDFLRDKGKSLTGLLSRPSGAGKTLAAEAVADCTPQRSDDSLLRNAVTSIVLRHLEYYKGILLLTTNRLKASTSVVSHPGERPLRRATPS